MERVKAGLFILIGVSLVALAIGAVVRTHRFLREAAIAPGRVASLNAGGAHPEIEFTTQKGEVVSYPQGGFIGGYRSGDHVTVRYRAESPQETATIDALGALWFSPMLLALLCTGIGLAGIINFPRNRR